MNLEQYFSTQIHFDRRDLRSVEDAISDCEALYLAASKECFHDTYGWAYELKSASEALPTRLSFSTTSMIGTSLQRLAGVAPAIRAAQSYDERPLFKPLELSKSHEIKKNVEETIKIISKGIQRFNSTGRKFTKQAHEKLVRDVVGPENATRIQKEKFQFSVLSSTYLRDDPASLSWCFDLVRSDDASSRMLITSIKKVLEKFDSKNTPGIESGKIIDVNPSEVGESNFMHVHLARVARALIDSKSDEQKALKLEGLADHFESNLHKQLSFGEIPDSRFDAVELIFCLEGLLLCETWRVDDRLFDRTLNLLKKSQEANSFWRSETPIVLKRSGHVLLPVAVEAANSLMSAISRYDKYKIVHSTKASQSVEMFRRFWRWLKSRRVEVTMQGGEKVYGWHSEHVNLRSVIHLWETSQVLEFLLSYRHMLKLHIGRTTLELSGVTNVWPKESDTREEYIKRSKWEKRWAGYEPSQLLEKKYQLYERLKRDFLDDRFENNTMVCNLWGGNNWSMMLYGPPGTGKSSAAENLAKEFDCRLISISVSDFMAAGPTQMEARAKQIFEMLEAQPFSVVLFDEFDPFMYNREGEHFRRLSADFQLMTNGMLPKLQNLRKNKAVIFIFATNFFDRIDPAIRRRGRFDQFYMVPPLDWAARKRVFLDSLKDGNRFDEETLEALKAASCLFGYSDIKVAYSSVKASPKKVVAVKDVLNQLNEMSPATSLKSYERRLFTIVKREDGKTETSEEFNEQLVEEFLSIAIREIEAGKFGSTTEPRTESKELELIKRVLSEVKKHPESIGWKSTRSTLLSLGGNKPISLNDSEADVIVKKITDRILKGG